MKQDLDRLMHERKLDAIVIEGPDGLIGANAPWNYMVNGEHLTGVIIKRRDHTPQLIYNPMERQQAEATGLEIISSGRWDIREIYKTLPGRLESMTELRRQMLTDLEVRGRIGWYGTVEASEFLALTAALQQAMPSIEIVGDFEQPLIDEARRTKDADEIAKMDDVGRRTCAVVQAVVDFIAAQRNDGDTVVDAQGQPVTIGDVKALIRREIDRQGLEEASGTIFAQGTDAGIPHASGNVAAALRLGQPIVFDIFPRDRTTGYYHDMTRTFAIGYTSPELESVYDDVRTAFDGVVSALKVGEQTRAYQDLACKLFKERGHKTTEDEYPLEAGYVHSLGHGLGLEVHEPLAFSSLIDRGDVLEPGTVFTIEPGLYYSDQGLGVRIEDTYVCDLDGSFRSLTPFPYDLVIPVGG